MPEVAATPPRRSQTIACPETESSWRTLTPPPKTNAIPKSPFEAQVFHRMVEHLQEEQANQSAQAPSVQEMDDTSVSLTEHDPGLATTTVNNTAVVVDRTTTDTPSTSVATTTTPNTTARGNHYNLMMSLNEEPLPQTHDEEMNHINNNEDTIGGGWDWSLQHPKLSPFPDLGTVVGTPEILSSLIRCNKEECSSVTSRHTRMLGIQMLSLDSAISWYSGRIHKDHQHYFCFAGRVRLWRLQPDGTTIPTEEIECHEHVAVPPYTPHMLEALEEQCLVAAWSFDDTIDNNKYNNDTTNVFQPYQELVECLNGTTAAASEDDAETPTTLKQTMASSIARKLKTMGKNQVFWAGMAAGLSVGFLYGRRRR